MTCLYATHHEIHESVVKRSLAVLNIDIFENLSPNRWKKGISVKFCNRVGTKNGERPFDVG